MLRIFETLKHKSETALRSALLLAAAGGLAVMALGFAAGALVLVLTQWMPLWGALLLGAGALTAAALIALAAAGARPKTPVPVPNPAPAAALLGLAAQSGSLKELILRLAEQEARTNPAAAAAIAAAAGLLLGALDAQRESPPQGGSDSA